MSDTSTSQNPVSKFWKWIFTITMAGVTLCLIFNIHCRLNNLNAIANPDVPKMDSSLAKLQHSIMLRDSCLKTIPADSACSANAKSAGSWLDTLSTQLKHFESTAQYDEHAYRDCLVSLVALCGALGSMIYILSSFVNFWGSDKLDANWLGWYVAKPFIGTGLALITFFAFRAGFLTGVSSDKDLNVYGVLTIASLVGLFSDDATLKLKEIFETIFKPEDKRTGTLDNNDKKTPPVTTEPGLFKLFKLMPSEMSASATTEIKIVGTGFNKDMHVKCNNETIEASKMITVDENLIAFNLGPFDSTVSSVKIVVYNPADNKEYDAGTIVVKST